MKVLLLTPCLLLFLLPVSLGQNQLPGIQNAIIPCAKETGASDADLEAIKKGDLSSLRGLHGCLADCVAKKSGIMSADNVFQKDVFKEKIAKITTDEMAQKHADICGPLAGTGECKVFEPVFACLTGAVFGFMYP